MPKVIYELQDCLNPDCPNKTFLPSRSDKKFCDDTCRSRFHFLKNREQNRTTYKSNQELKRIDRDLKKLYENCEKNKISYLTEEIFLAEDIPLNRALEISAERKSGNRIFWYYKYGVMGTAKNQFRIVKKETYEK